KEGAIPGFYKRTDAHLLGMCLGSEPSTVVRPKRLALPVPPEHAVADRAERAYQMGRRLVRASAPDQLPHVRLQAAKELDEVRAVSAAARAGRALTEFEPFGRGGDRRSY